MLVVRSDAHLAHAPKGEIHNGELVPPFESPDRWRHIVKALEGANFEMVGPGDLERDLVQEVHDPAYVTFLEGAWSDWTANGNSGDMIPTCFPTRRMQQREPVDIDGRLGYFAFAAETSITSGTWSAAWGGAALAREAQRRVSGGASSAFALCRPPGHHAGIDYFGGYCFLNNAAIAAQGFLRDGAERVAVVDIDFHHGNGTQDIFYNRSDVLFLSLHGDPRHEFPHFLGFADETGDGPGTGATRNYPLLPGTDAAKWFAALDDACLHLEAFEPDALVVSLGVDTFEQDPISSFKLASSDFVDIGTRLGTLGLPTVYCMEGGYAVEEIGTNTVNVLVGHEQADSS